MSDDKPKLIGITPADTPRCTAHNKKGERCKRWAMRDQRVCEYHGGKSPQALENAKRKALTRKTIGKLGEEFERLSRFEVPDPFTGLSDAYALAARITRAFTNLAGDLDSPLIVDRFGEPKEHPLLKMAGEWLDRYARFAKQAGDADIEARKAQIAEAQALKLLSIVDEAVREADLDLKQERALRAEIASRLRQVDALPTSGTTRARVPDAGADLQGAGVHPEPGETDGVPSGD